MFVFAGDLVLAEAGNEGGFDLRPRFRRNLAAHVRLNLTASRAIAGSNPALATTLPSGDLCAARSLDQSVVFFAEQTP